MNQVFFILIGLISGIAGGMGMGGGTLLIPLLSIFLGVVQKEAQLLNVFSFVIMAIFVVYIHIKNKLINVFPAIMFSVLAAVFAVIFSLLVKDISNTTLKTFFGVFLIILALIQAFSLIIKKRQKK
ncbi:MAG: TSUP family transporter [Clostridia bacterium]|nr:TSUP family transporter [Clostridia bacterium]